MPILDIKKWHFGWPNQNSRATFIVKTFPKYGLKDVDLMNLSFLTPLWPNFYFVDIRAYFGNFPLWKMQNIKVQSPYDKDKDKDKDFIKNNLFWVKLFPLAFLCIDPDLFQDWAIF